MSTRSFTVFALFSVLLAASTAHAAPIFIQNAFNTGFPSDREFDTLFADDFSIAASDTVRSVSWMGLYSPDNTAPAVDDFEIRFYADATGAPGVLLQTFAVGNAVARTAVGTLSTFTTYSYIGDLAAGFGINAGTPYWLVIANDTTGDNDNWFWAAQTSGGNAQFSLNDGGSWAPTLVDGATVFTVGNGNVAVPEPASLLLVGIGVAAALRRKSRSSGTHN